MLMTNADLKPIRLYYGLTQTKLAQITGVTPTYISMIELEKRALSPDMVQRLISALSLNTASMAMIRDHYATVQRF